MIARCREIATYTEVPGQITRTFLSPPTHSVHALLRGWMEAAGMKTSIDAAGNLRGHLPSKGSAKSKRVILGSHLDTVPNSGPFDGILGVVLAIDIAEHLHRHPDDSPAIEILGFSEEEGVRFRKPFLGSLAVVGRLDETTLALTDPDGMTVAQAIRNYGLDPAHLPEATLAPKAAAYLEVHIEQGPVLESLTPSPSQSAGGSNSPSPDAVTKAPLQPATADPPADHPLRSLGIVDAIAGQTRLLLTLTGQANHAGTTPMHLRHDALAATAEWMVAVEAHAIHQPGLVATVGSLTVEPGASNVIPGLVRATLDVRHANDATRAAAVAELLALASSAAETRGVTLTHQATLDQPAVPMDAHLQTLLRNAATRAGHNPHTLTSGAGHDAMILAPHLPSAMLFVPSPGGLSHHPDESVLAADVEAAIETVLEFLRSFGDDEIPAHG